MGESFGRRVYQARLALQAMLGREVTQAEIGKQVGVTGQAVGLWEQGKSEPKLAVIARLAVVLRTDPAYLAFGIQTIKGEPAKAPPGTPDSAPFLTRPARVAEPSESPPKRPREDDRHLYETLKDRTERKKRGKRKRA